MAGGSSSGWSSALAGGADTIVAPATAAGRAALAIVRVSGPGSLAIAAVVCPRLDVSAHRLAQLVAIRDLAGAVVERGVVVPYLAPMSFTGEDMLEIMVHGAPVVVAATVAALLAAGCRPARAGEFTRRAVANGKLDLMQAEALADLIAAETEAQARSARRQQAGALSARVIEIRLALTELLAAVEGALDFGDQEVVVEVSELEHRLGACRAMLRGMLATAAAGSRLRDGATVVISGSPNTGKSTLFNALVGEQRAIVSERAGTTRDLIEARVELGGLAVRLVDTAGLAEDADPIGAEGVRRARCASADADVRVLLWPCDQVTAPAGWDGEDANMVRVRSKSDLRVAAATGGLAVSAVTGEGLAALGEAIVAALGVGGGEVASGLLVNQRQRDCLERARQALTKLPLELPEVVAAGVRGALDALAELIGEVTDEAVLDAIFSRFCIGK